MFALQQEAHIGIGISGNEGVQAVRSADYAIGQFKYLERLLLVHGRWNYRRICSVILYSFYKTITFVFTLFIYGFFNGNSGTTLYETWLSSSYNVLWTSLPVLAMGIFDQDVREETALAHPSVYRVGQEKLDMNLGKMAKMLVNSLWHASVIFFVPAAIFWGTNVTSPDGHSDGLYIFGTTVNAACMIVVTLKAMLMTRNWTSYNIGSYFFSAGIWFGFVALYSEMMFVSPRFFGLMEHLYLTPAFWLALPITSIVAILPDYVAQYLQFNYFPELWDKLRKLEAGGHADSTHIFGKDTDERDMLVARTTPAAEVSVNVGNASVYGTMSEASGYDFSMAEVEHKPAARRPTKKKAAAAAAAVEEAEPTGHLIRL